LRIYRFSTAVRFLARFGLAFPIFISSCGLGFMRTSAPIRRSVDSSNPVCGVFAMKRISDLSPEERRHLCEFNFTDGPVESPDAEGLDLPFAAFGFAAMAWARLETHLNALLIHLNKRRFSKEIFDPQHPVSFSRKLRLLKEWFSRHKALKPYKREINKLATQMKTLSGYRNDYLHALFSAYDPAKTEVTLRGLHYVGGEKFHITRRDFSTHKLIVFGMTANSVNRSLAVITSALFTPGAVERLGKS
jgi:hypothetical protein